MSRNRLARPTNKMSRRRRLSAGRPPGRVRRRVVRGAVPPRFVRTGAVPPVERVERATGAGDRRVVALRPDAGTRAARLAAAVRVETLVTRVVLATGADRLPLAARVAFAVGVGRPVLALARRVVLAVEVVRLSLALTRTLRGTGRGPDPPGGRTVVVTASSSWPPSSWSSSWPPWWLSSWASWSVSSWPAQPSSAWSSPW